MNVVLIYNPKSGGAFSLRHLRKLCAQAGVTISYSFPITDLGSKKLASLIANGVVVAAVGGDGTMNSVASKLIGSRSTLLPLPGGTMNHFSKDIGMAATVDAVLAGARRGKTMLVDVAFVNDQLFVNNSSIGLYPLSLLDRERTQKRLGKWPAAAWAGARQFIRFRRYRLLVDGAKVRTPFIFVGNNEYKLTDGGFPIRDTLQKGILSVMLATVRSRAGLTSIIMAALIGRAHKHEEFDSRRVKMITIDSSRQHLAVSFDGEVAHFTPPLVYVSKPNALRVLHVPGEK